MTTNLSEVSYDYSEKFLSLANKFFNVSDTSTLKVGMFGYHNDIHSNMMKDSVFHRNMLYNEFFINNASLHSSVYNWAKILNEPVTLNTPARLQASITINVPALESSLTIKKDTKFIIGNFTYLLPYSITVLNSTAGGIIASYNFDDINYIDLNASKNSFLPIFAFTDESGLSVVSIQVTLYQLDKKSYIYKVLSDDILERSIYDVSYSGSLAYFNVYYQEPNVSTVTTLTKIFTDSEDNTVDKSVFYTPVSESALRLYFSTKAGFFKPVFNSTLTVDIYTTKGTEGNFSYTGGSINIINSGFTNISAVSLSDSTSGNNGETLLQTKTRLLKTIRSRKGISTTYDLDALFSEFEANSSTFASKITSIKFRDDILTRQFNTYTLLKDSSNAIIPTNTIDLDLSILDIEELGYSLKPGTLILYDRTYGKYRLLNSLEVPDFYLNSRDSYLFCVPFLVNLDFKEFPKTNYYMTNYNKSYKLYNYAKGTNNFYSVINYFNITRNSLLNPNDFIVSCTVYSNPGSYTRRVKLNAYRNGIKVAYIEMPLKAGETGNGTIVNFEAFLNTNDTFDASGNYLILNSFYDVTTNVLIPSFPLDDTLEFRFDTGISAGDGSFDLITSLKTDEKLFIADDISDIMRSRLYVDEDTGMIKIEKLPLVAAFYFLNDKLNEQVSNSLRNTISLLRNSVNFLHNNTDLNLAFYNSSSISNNMSSDTIDLVLDYQIKFKVPLTETLKYNIKKFIVDFIESSNNTVDRSFALSNLNRELENNFSEISYIRFANINGSNIQSVHLLGSIINYGVTENYPKNFIPEFLTVRKIAGSDLVNTDFTYDISIVPI